MKANGQLFATDFLIAMIIVILGFGIMAAQLELNIYQNKEKTNDNALSERTETAAIALANSEWSACDINGTKLAYSINKDKIALLSENTVKERIGLTDYNAQITLVGKSPRNIMTEPITNQNIYAIDIDVLTCTKDANFADLNFCMNSLSVCDTPNIWMSTLKIKVGK